MAIVCERMHWDYFTFEQQPSWFVELLLKKWELDAKAAEGARSRMP